MPEVNDDKANECNVLKSSYHLAIFVQEKQFRKVRHLQYSWTEKNLPPNGSGILDLIGRVQGSQQASGNNPIVVHDRLERNANVTHCWCCTGVV